MSGRERGSATVLALGVIAVLILLLGGALTVARVVRSASQAAAAADMAALAGARVLQTNSQSAACTQAARVAVENGGLLTSCVAQGPDLTVAVAVVSGVPGAGPAVARARAGPAGPLTTSGPDPPQQVRPR